MYSTFYVLAFAHFNDCMNEGLTAENNGEIFKCRRYVLEL
jgi:hypothetical protein